MSKPSIVFLILLLIIAGQANSGESPADSLSAKSLELGKTLDNGMQVFIRSVPEAALVRVGVFYASGSALEPDSLAGLAHFSEHLLMQNSLNYPDGELHRKLKLFSTYTNAYTGSAYMQFDTECLPVFLPEILALEADRLQGVTIDSLSFEREKAIVLEEMAMTKRLPPLAQFMESVFYACYPGHPFSREVIGTSETMDSIGLDDFLHFQQNYIRPERSAIVVKGPLDAEKTLAEIERIFQPGPPGETVFPKTPPYPPVTSSQTISDSQEFVGLKLCLAFRISLMEELDTALIAVLPHIMEESGLHAYVRNVPGEAVLMLTSSYLYNRPSTNNEDHWGRIYYEFDPEQQSLRSMGYMWENLSTMVEDMGNLEEYKKRINNAITKLGSTRRNPGESRALGTALVNGNEYLTISRIEEILQNAGPGDFNRFMDRWVNPDRAVVGVNHGRDSERNATIRLAKATSADPSLVFAHERIRLTRAEINPVLEAYRKADLIQLNRFELENGIPVFSLHIPESDHWAMAGHRTFKGIKNLRPGKKPGLDLIFNKVINYDPKQKRDPDRFYPARKLPYDLEFNLDWNHSEFFVKGSVKKMDRIISAIDKRISSRDFNSIRWSAVTRWGEEYLRDTGNRKRTVARAWRMQMIFGPEHPATGRWAPDPEAFRKVNYKDLSNLHQDYVQETGNLVLMVAGRETQDTLRPVLNSTIGQYDSWEPAEKDDFPEARVQGIQGQVVPDLTRGDVVLDLAFPLVQPPSGDQPTITTLAFEKALHLALTERLRHKEGLTYGVSTRVNASPGHHFLEIFVTCQPGQGPLVLASTHQELSRIVMKGFGEDEIAEAQLNLYGQAIRNFSDQESGLRLLMRMSEFGEIPLKPLREISMITSEQVNAYARRAIDPENFVYTVTGPLFEEDIENFDIP